MTLKDALLKILFHKYQIEAALPELIEKTPIYTFNLAVNKQGQLYISSRKEKANLRMPVITKKAYCWNSPEFNCCAYYLGPLRLSLNEYIHFLLKVY